MNNSKMRGIQDVGTSAIDSGLNFTPRQVVPTFFSTPSPQQASKFKQNWPKINSRKQ